MTGLLDELKTRARVRLNAGRRAAQPDAPADARGPRLRDCLHEVARAAGFAHWEHARHVLGGAARPGDDMGAFWYARGCGGLLNVWIAQAGEAQAAHAAAPGSFLVPYGRQFILVQDSYVRELGLDPADPAWAQAGCNLVAAYGSDAWARLALQRLRAQRAAAG